MLLAVIADVHLDASFSWAGPLVGRRLRQALRDALRLSVERAQDLAVDAFLVAGDLFEDQNYAHDTPELLRDLFESLAPTPVLLTPGNHDFAGRESPYRSVAWSPNVYVFPEPELTPFRLSDGLTIWGAGHDRPAGTPGFFEAGFKVDGGGIHLALFHGAERGRLRFEAEGKLLHAPFDAEEVERAGLSYAFAGHYHNARDGAYLSYPGNLEHLSFGEAGERGLVLAEVDGNGRVSITREVLARTVMHDVRVDGSGCTTLDAVYERVREAIGAVPPSSGVRVGRLVLTGEVPSELDVQETDLVSLRGDLDALTMLPPRLRAPVDLGAISREPTVRGSFVRLVREDTGLDEDERDLVLRTGLRALAGRDDLEVL